MDNGTQTIGFSENYDKFDEHVDGGSFRRNADATATILAKLTAVNEGTHTDPGTGFVNGFKQ